jgi:cytidylate kinase
MPDDLPINADDAAESPHHGFQGDRGVVPATTEVPAGPIVAVSREAGARGGTIAVAVGRKLGWQVYDQELLEYATNESPLQQELIDSLSPVARQWIDQRLDQLQREQTISQNPSVQEMVRAVLALGARGNAVLVGRGAGSVLPSETTLNVRVVAPLSDRIAYMSQWLRLTVEEAAERVRQRDNQRSDFLGVHFHKEPGELYSYDLILNSSLLGEDTCAALIAQAVRSKFSAHFDSAS